MLNEVTCGFIASDGVEKPFLNLAEASPRRPHRRSRLSSSADTSMPAYVMLYNRVVRRLLAIALALLVALPAISPLLALGTADDSNRPACCRRNGKHHCMLTDMDMGAPASSAPSGTHLTPATISERCPYGAKALPGTTHPDWSLQSSEAIFAGVVAHPSIAPQTESKRRISADRSRQKRGPPSAALA